MTLLELGVKKSDPLFLVFETVDFVFKDVSQEHMNKLKSGFTNITWFTTFNGKQRSNTEFEWNKISGHSDVTVLSKRLDTFDYLFQLCVCFEPEFAFAHDAIAVIASTVVRMAQTPGFLKSFRANSPSGVNRFLSCYNKNISLNQYGSRMMEYLKKVSLYLMATILIGKILVLSKNDKKQLFSTIL